MFRQILKLCIVPGASSTPAFSSDLIVRHLITLPGLSFTLFGVAFTYQSFVREALTSPGPVVLFLKIVRLVLAVSEWIIKQRFL